MRIACTGCPFATCGVRFRHAWGTVPQACLVRTLWVDDLHLFETGGGSPTNGTIYGAPANRLAAGRHLAVGYARTAFGGTVVAWPFPSARGMSGGQSPGRGSWTWLFRPRP